MKTNVQNRALAVLLGSVTLMLAGTLSAVADNLTWTGGSVAGANWNDTADWTNSAGAGAVPATGDNLIFSGFAQMINTNDLPGGLTAGWVRFDNGDFSLYSNPQANALTISGVTNVSGGNIFFMPLTLGGAQSVFDIAGSSALTLTNTLALTHTLGLTGDGDSSLGGVVSGAGGITKDGAGSLTISGANSYTGGLIVNAGTLNANTPNGSAYGGVGNGSLVVNSGAIVNVNADNALVGQGATVGPPRTVTINANGTIQTDSGSGHMAALILNGGRLFCGTARGDYGNWNLDFGVSTPTNGSVSAIDGGNVTLGQTGGTVFNIGAGDTVNVSSVIAHTTYATDLGLIKSGTGLLTLSAANTYSSATVIREGTLALSGAGSIEPSPTITLSTNAVFDISGASFSIATNQTLSGSGRINGTVNDNNASAILAPGGNGAAGTLALDTLALKGNLALNIDLASVATVGGGVNDLLIVTNLNLAPSLTGTNTVSFNFLNVTPLVGGVYTLIQYVTYTGPATIVDTLASSPTRYTFTFTNDTSVNAIKVIVGGNPASLVWKGDGLSNLWDVITSPNWLKDGTPDVFYQADNVTFNDIGSNNTPISITTVVQPTTVTVNAAKDYALAGPGKISGSGSLLKSGSGDLTVLANNDNTGNSSVSGSGILSVGNGTVSGTLGAGNLTNGNQVVFYRADSFTYPGSMNGAGSVVKLGAGTLTMTGTNTATGGLTISNGVVQIGNFPTTIPGASVAGPITNHGDLYYSRSDAFTLPNSITSAGITRQFGGGNLFIRGAGGMTVDGTAPINLQGTINVGQGTSGQAGYGKLTISPGASITANNFLLGNQNNAGGADVIQLGGTANSLMSDNTFRIGHWATEISTWLMGGGALNVAGQLNAGWDGIGLLYQTGGTINCGTLNVDANGATAAIGGTNSTYWLTGGRINIGSGGIGGNTYTINLGNGTIGANASFSSSLNMNLTNGSPAIDTAGNTVTLSGVLSGWGGLTKQGTGALNLNGANTFTNAVTVAGGILQGTGTIIGPISVQSGAALSAGGTLGTGTLTVSNATFDAGAGLVIDLSSTAATSDLLAAKGTLTLDTATPVTFNFLGGTPFSGAAYTIVTNWVPRSGALAYVNPTRYTCTLDQNNPNRIQVTFTGSNANLVWKGNVNNLWNVNTDANWLSGGAASTFYQSDVVIFDDNGLGQPSVNLASDVSPASVTVNSSGNYSFAGGAIASVGNLVKSGAGTLTLANSNFVGNTVLNAGTLQVGNGTTTGALNGNIADYSSLVFNHSDTLAYAGVISGPGTLRQAGTGTLLLIGNSTFFGGATINAGGTVQLGNGLLADSGVLGIGPVNNLGSIIYNRASQIAVAAPHSGNGSLTFLGTGLLGQSSYSMNATNTFTGPVTLSKARLIGNLGGVSLGSPSSINVQQGSQVYAIGTAFSPVFNLPVTVAGAGWWESSGVLGALRLNGGANWAGPITLAGNTRITAYNDGNSNVITGTISGGVNELEIGASGGTSALLSLAPASANTFGALRLSPGILVLGNANALPNNLPLIMNGGVLRLNGNNVASKDFTAPGGGTFQNGSSTTPVNLSLTLNGGFTAGIGFADLGAQTFHTTYNLIGPWGFTNTTASTAWSGNLTNNGGYLFTGINGGFGGYIYPGRYLVANNGTFGMTVNNVFGGGGILYQPTVILNNSTMSSTRYNTVGPVYLNGSTLTQSVSDSGGYQGYQFRGAITVVGSAPSTISTGNGKANHLRDVTVFDVADVTGNANVDLIVGTPLADGSGDYSGAGNLVKTGVGTMRLDAVSTYTGSTVISNGTLTLGASAALASPAITVASGATFDVSAIAGGFTLAAGQALQGSGTVKGNVSDGSGIIRPGTSAGTLTIGGSLTLGGSGNLEFELSNNTASGNDRIQVNGALSLNDFAPTPISFKFLNGAPATGTYTIMNYTGALTGTSAGLTNTQGYAVTFTVGGGTVRATFAAAPAQSLVWQGDASGNSWDLVTTSVNWSNAAALVLTNFYQLDTVRFDDSSANTTVYINDNVNPASITLDSTNDYTLTTSSAGKITGATSLTKNNTNTVTLGTANDFTGPTTLGSGVLKLGAAGALGATNGALTIDKDATLDVNGFTAMGKPVVVSGSGVGGGGAIDNSGASAFPTLNRVTLAGDTTFGNTANRWDLRSPGQEAGTPDTAELTCAGGGAFNLTKVGPGYFSLCSATVDINLANIDVQGGTFEFNGTDTGLGNPTNTVTVYSNANFTYYNATNLLDKKLLVLDGGTIAKGGGGGANVILGTVTLGTNAGANCSLNVGNAVGLTFSNVISGPGNLLSMGTGPLRLASANTYSGGTVISNGPVNVNGAGASGTASIVVSHPNALGTGPVTISGGSITADTQTNTFRALEFNLANGATLTNDINLPTVLVTNLGIQGRDATSVFTLSGKISGGYANLTNWLDNGAGNVGVARLSNPANDFLGTIALRRGTLALTTDALGNPGNYLDILTNGTLRFDGASVNLGHNIRTGPNAQNTVILDLYGDNNGDGVQDTVNNATISGIISGAGTVYPRGTNGVLTLTGANTLTTGIELQQPLTLQVAASANLGPSAYVAIKFGSTFRYTGTGTETMTRTLWMDNNGGGTIDVANPSATLTWNPGGGTVNQNFTKAGAGGLTYGGVIAGNAVVKVNGGTLTLTGANTYVGPTLVNGGTLFVNGSLPAANAVTVASGATLGGNGTINCPVSLLAGSFFQPGAAANTIGTLTVKSPLALVGSTTMEINGTSGTGDSVVGLSTVTYGGTLTVNNLGGAPAPGMKFTLFSAVDRLGNFSSVTLPSLTAPLYWTNMLAIDGSIMALSPVNTNPTNITAMVSGGNLNLSWPTDHLGWRLEGQTNSVGISTNWVTVPGSTSVNTIAVPIDPANPTVFYRLVYP